jgi:hypothetical protein
MTNGRKLTQAEIDFGALNSAFVAKVGSLGLESGYQKHALRIDKSR